MRPSDYSPNSERTELSPLEAIALDLLVDGASSVAAIYASAVHTLALLDRVEPRALVHALERLRKMGLVTAWIEADDKIRRTPTAWDIEESIKEYEARPLTLATVEDLAVDEVGLWYEITDAGRARWRSAGSIPDTSRWRIEQIMEEGVVRAYAHDRPTAERVLREWASTHSCGDVDLTRAVVRNNVSFLLADGSSVVGVEITCPYQSGE